MSSIEQIQKLMKSCGQTPDIIDGYLEGDLIELMERMVGLDMKEEFAKLVYEISISQIASFNQIIPYLIEKINSSDSSNKFWTQLTNSYWHQTLRTRSKSKSIPLGSHLLKRIYFSNPDEIYLELELDNQLYKTSIKSEDVNVLIDLSDYLNWLSESGGLEKNEFEIIKLDNKIILNLQQVNKFELTC